MFQRFSQNNPALSIALIVAAATLVMFQFGSVMVFVFSVALPMLGEYCIALFTCLCFSYLFRFPICAMSLE